MAGKTFHLLHIDDDESDRVLLARAVHDSEHPIQLQSVTSCEEALQVLESRTILPDLILLDIRMPMMSGFEFVKILKEQECLREIPVILFSDSPRVSDVSRARALGVQSYCVKPPALEGFTAFIRKVHEGWARPEVSRERRGESSGGV